MIILDGLVHVTGDPDSGKTTFAIECGAEPSCIAFIDSDIKGRSTARELAEAGFPFGLYRDLVMESRGMRELELHAHCRNIIESIDKDQFDVVIWDTWAPFAKTCHPYVMKNPGKFRLTWSPMGTIKGAQQWNAAFDYEASLIAYLLSLTKLLILTSHLKNAYRGNKRIPGKFTPDCSKAIVRKARLRIWLRRSPTSPKPIGLILKRLSLPMVSDKGIRVTNILPLRMEECTWDEIARYMDAPIGNREPDPGEIPDAYELSLLEGTLTPDQERTFQLMLQQGGLDEELEEMAERGKIEPPKTWQELLTRTGKDVGDLGGPAAAFAMTGEEVRERWEEWK